MADTPDIVMQDGEEASPIPDDQSEIAMADSSTTGAIKPLPAGIVPPDKTSTAPSQEVIDRFAPGSAPHWVGATGFLSKDVNGDKSATGASGYVKGGPTPTPRNLPVKRYDGEPLSRSDLQHNVLCHLFSDTTRCFQNPRPGPVGPDKSATWKSPVPVYPYGMARTCARRSDETEAEKTAYDVAVAAFEAAPFVDTEAVIKKEVEGDAETGEGEIPPSLRAREGYPPPGSNLLTFKELYIEALMHSGKCTKAMRDKIIADEEFAEDFAKVCLLVNVGRINTTLAFYPEMKTILRSYHPLPSLQRNENTRRHLQDAPRMKSLLKSVLLDGEKPGIAGSGTATGALAGKNARVPAVEGPGEETPADMTELIKRKAKGKGKAVTSVITIIFLLAMHSADITTLHFTHPHDFFTLFFPHPDIAVPSKERARTFLWLIWHYLEGGAVLPPGSYGKNPFDDDTTSQSLIKAQKAWENLTIAEQAKVNVNGYWRGTKNPEYQEYKKRKAAMEGNKDREGSTESRVEEAADAPPELLDRVLAPALSIIEHTVSAEENIDSEDEKAWGQKMRDERGAFLLRFQEEEQAKIQEADEQKKGAEAEAEGDKTTKEKTGKKRVMAGGGSSYPLANILAAANAEKAAAAAAAAASANGDGINKRRRDSAGFGDEDDDRYGSEKADSLWDLDLTIPRSALAALRGSHRADRSSQSLPRLAWRRILERAQRGVGDASYESDDESVALDEARDERPRVELARVLRSLRDIRTGRGEIIRT